VYLGQLYPHPCAISYVAARAQRQKPDVMISATAIDSSCVHCFGRVVDLPGPKRRAKPGGGGGGGGRGSLWASHADCSRGDRFSHRIYGSIMDLVPAADGTLWAMSSGELLLFLILVVRVFLLYIAMRRLCKPGSYICVAGVILYRGCVGAPPGLC
jgi:hypothetical protein